LVLLTHAHFDIFQTQSAPFAASQGCSHAWGMATWRTIWALARGRVGMVERFSQREWKVTLTLATLGARVLRDNHVATAALCWSTRGVHLSRGDSALFRWLQRYRESMGGGPEIALLPIGAYHPDTFRAVHMGPDEAMRVFKDFARNGWSRCITVPSAFHSRIWTNAAMAATYRAGRRIERQSANPRGRRTDVF